MIRVYGGSGTEKALFQSIVDQPISTIGVTGQISWKASSQLPIVVSTILAVGRTEFTLDERLAQESFDLEWCVFRKPTRNLGSLPGTEFAYVVPAEYLALLLRPNAFFMD